LVADQEAPAISFAPMVTYERPRGLTETSAIMAITNAMGWGIIDWSRADARLTFAIFTSFILVGYVVIWFFWNGRNWARILVLLTSILCLYNLRYWSRGGLLERVMIGAEAVTAVFLLYWLNTSKIRAFFAQAKS
jgi:hypothetical protein